MHVFDSNNSLFLWTACRRHGRLYAYPIFKLKGLTVTLYEDLNRLQYSRLSLFRSPRESLKYFEILVPRHIRLAELRKKNKSNNHISQMNMQCDTWNKRYCGKEEKILHRCNFSSFPQYLLPIFLFSCLNRDQIFTFRWAVIRYKRNRDNVSRS